MGSKGEMTGYGFRSGTTWDPQSDAVVEKALPADMLSDQAARAVKLYWPQFNAETEVQGRELWAYMFQGIVTAEAGLNPTSDVHHRQAAVNMIDPETHRPARRRRALGIEVSRNYVLR